MAEEKQSLNVAEAAELLGLRPATIYKLSCCRLIPYFKLGARNIYDREELLAWRAARRVPTIAES